MNTTLQLPCHQTSPASHAVTVVFPAVHWSWHQVTSVALLCHRRSNPALLTRCWPSYCVSMLTWCRVTAWVAVVYQTVKSTPSFYNISRSHIQQTWLILVQYRTCPFCTQKW